jgi:hypothetical protein
MVRGFVFMLVILPNRLQTTELIIYAVTLIFSMRARIAASIHIVHGLRFHLAACAEISTAARIDCSQKMPGWWGNKF